MTPHSLVSQHLEASHPASTGTRHTDAGQLTVAGSPGAGPAWVDWVCNLAAGIGVAGGVVAAGTLLFLWFVLRLSALGFTTLAPVALAASLTGLAGASIQAAILAATGSFALGDPRTIGCLMLLGGTLLTSIGAFLQRNETSIAPGTWWSALGAASIIAGVAIPVRAANTYPVAMTVMLAIMYVLAVATWSGGMVALFVLVKKFTALELKSTMPRFTDIVQTAAAVAVCSTIGLIFSQGYTWLGLISTIRGNLMLAHLAGTILLAGLSVYTAQRIMPRFDDRGLRDRASGQLLIALPIHMAVMTIGVFIAVQVGYSYPF